MAKKARNKKKSKSKSRKTKKATKTKGFAGYSGFTNPLPSAPKKIKANFVKMMVGGNATGKTTNEISIAKVWLKENPKGHLVAYDPQGKIKEVFGSRCIIIQPNQIDSFKGLTNCLFIIDDTLLFAKCQNGRINVNINELVKILSVRRINDFDFIFSVHNPSLLNRIQSIVSFVTDYYIFTTFPYPCNDNYKWIANYNLVSKAIELMNLYHKIWGREYSFFNFLHVNYSGITASGGIDKEKMQIVTELLEIMRRSIEDALKLQESEYEVTIKKQAEEEIKNESHNADSEDMADFLIEAIDVATKTNASRNILSRLKKIWTRHLSSLNGGQRTSFLNSVFMTTVTMAIAQKKAEGNIAKPHPTKASLKDK